MKVVVEIESLCQTYLEALAIGEPALLTTEEMDAVIEKFRTYGRTSRAAPLLASEGRIGPALTNLYFRARGNASWPEGNPAMSDTIDFTSAAAEGEVIGSIVRRMKADSGTIHIVGTDGLLHLQAATPGFPEVVMATIRTIPVGKGMAGLAAQRRLPVDACNIQTDTSGDVRPGARATALSGGLVVPIFRGEAVIGTLGVGNRSERVFTPEETEELLGLGRSLAARYPQAGAI
jgi:hypothetical protein